MIYFSVAIDLIVQTIKDLLQNTSVQLLSTSPPSLQAQVDQFRRSRHMSDSRILNRSISHTGTPSSSSSSSGICRH